MAFPLFSKLLAVGILVFEIARVVRVLAHPSIWPQKVDRFTLFVLLLDRFVRILLGCGKALVA